MAAAAKKGIALKEVLEKLFRVAETSVPESWDNTGLLIEAAYNTDVKTILLTNDLTQDVTEEAIINGANLIISYHPPIFNKLNKITGDSWKELIVAQCLANNISVYSPHTIWDNMVGGNADWLIGAYKENYERVKSISPKMLLEDCDASSEAMSTASDSYSLMGNGRICTLTSPMLLKEAVDKLKKHIGLKTVQLCLARGKTLDSAVESVACVAGSGASILKGAKADLKITGEMSHHEILDAIHTGSTVLLTGHCNSERGFLNIAKDMLATTLDDSIQLIISKSDKTPFVYI